MRREIIRTVLTAVAITLVVVSVPSVLVAGTVWRRLGLVGLCLTAAAVACWFGYRNAVRVARPLQELARRAERVGDGSTVFEPMHTGIDEIDRLSNVFERRAGELGRELASERAFASDASHQLRTPLTALLMRLEEISISDDLEGAREEAIVGIEQVERMTSVVDELLSRTRVAKGAGREPTSLDSVIAALQREYQHNFAAARRSIYVSGERGLWVLVARSTLSQILSCLLENALQHGRGTVEVRARRSGPSVVVEVSDQGPGVDSQIAPRIFDRRVTTGGSGLGLTLARDLADASGGRLELRSSEGAVFALFLSAAQAPVTASR